MIRVVSLQAGGPGITAGLMVGDFVYGAEGLDFGVTGGDTGSGYVGAVQDLAMAVDRAEGSGGTLTLNLTRSGIGGVDVTVNVGGAGSLGPAWPAGSAKADSIFEWSCAEIHSKVQASSTADFGYDSGWFGMILLSHPDWNETSGTNPYRNSIDKLRTRCEAYLNGRILEPQEAYYFDGSSVVSNPNYASGGLENWDICSSAIFMALYRMKTGDASADAVVQTAAVAIAHRIQSWTQYDDNGALIGSGPGGGSGRMGHNGVHGDYSHYNGIGALNIINAHALPALALLKSAGADMSVNLGLSVNSQGIFSYETLQLTPTIEDKFRICWDYVKAGTRADDGGDDGNIGYVGVQSGWDSAGRTPGCLTGWSLYGMTPNADDTDKIARQADYVARRWFRQQHAHAYTLGGVVLSQLSMPFLSDRQERFFQENTRLYPALARQPDGSVSYFPGRQNNGGDSYLNYDRVALINAGMASAIRSGTLPGFSAPDPTRIHAWMRAPVNSWPAMEARMAVLSGGLNHSLDLDVTDVDGVILNPADYTATWTHVSGPGVTTFGSPNTADTTVSFPEAGIYQVELEVLRGGYTLIEPYDLLVETVTPPAGIVPYVVQDPSSQTVDQGDTVTFSVDAQGTGPLVYQWRQNGANVGDPTTDPQFVIESASAGSGGDYDCVITNSSGAVTSAVATLSIHGVGAFHWGGLWRDVFVGISGSAVSDLTSAASFPNWPDASGVIANAESPSGYGDNYGQRWSGWITPPEGGDYLFYVAADDGSELWLSTTDKRADRVLVAQKGSWTSERNWDGGAISAPIAMIGGQRYYLEVLHKEGTGGDNAGLTWNWRSSGVWATPIDGSEPLPGAILEYQVGGTLSEDVFPPADYPPLAHDQSLTVYGGGATGVTLTGEDFENATLSFIITGNPSKGALSGTAPDLTYTPGAGASGTDRFSFKANDGGQDSEIATVTISLIPETGGDLKVWDGSTDQLWSAGSNWVADVSPVSSDAVIFNSTSLANLTTSLNGNQSVTRIVVEDPLGPVTIGDNILTLSDGIEMRPATQDLTVSSGVALSGNQEWSVATGRLLISSGALSGGAELSKTGEGTLSLRTVSPLTGGIVVEEGSLELNGGGWYAGYVGGSGMLTVEQGATAINMVSHAFGSGTTPNRDLTLNGGRFRMQKETYIDDIFMTEGVIDNTSGSTSDLRARSGNGTVVTVHGAAKSSQIDCPFNLYSNVVFNVADGAAASDLLVTAPLRGGGKLTKNGGGRMTLSDVSTSSGEVDVSSGRLAVTGSLAVESSVALQAGTWLEGTGEVQGFVDNHGVVSPGIDGVAVLGIGTYSQAAGAAMVIELNGTTAGSGHDQVAITRAATLDGTLEVTLVSGFTPVVGDSFTVISSGSRVGTFEAIQLPILPGDRKWVTTYDPEGMAGLELSVAAIEPFAQWQDNRFGGDAGNPAIAGELADPDDDGIVNLMEYALNLDPLAGPPAGANGHDGLPAIESENMELAIIYRRNIAATDVTYLVEESDDVAISDPWAAAVVTESILSDDGLTQVIRASVPVSGEVRKFLRLKVKK